MQGPTSRYHPQRRPQLKQLDRANQYHHLATRDGRLSKASDILSRASDPRRTPRCPSWPTPSTGVSLLGFRAKGSSPGRRHTYPPLTTPPTTPFSHQPGPRRAAAFSTSTLVSDLEAGERVFRHFFRRHLHQGQIDAERKLRRLILSSPFQERDLPVVLQHANILFFEGLLTPHLHPIRWRSFSSSSGCPPHPRADEVIGTTEHRLTPDGNTETCISLSRTILQSTSYDMRLVLSALLHEAIHAYLFMVRGRAAIGTKADGGHSPAFRSIAALIDHWIGDPSYLCLNQVKADLAHFQTPPRHRQWLNNGWRPDKEAWGSDECAYTLIC